MRPAAPRLHTSLVLVAALVAGGCAGGHSPSATGGALVHVTERDFHITVSPDVVPAGPVQLVDTNDGPDMHELLVVRADGPLPMRHDGLTVDENAIHRSMAGQLDATAPDSHHVLRLRLRPGRYVLFCNMLGHYLGGMQAELVVR
jgi:uncharacterized cupredoxin-like copper-binding protein